MEGVDEGEQQETIGVFKMPQKLTDYRVQQDDANRSLRPRSYSGAATVQLNTTLQELEDQFDTLLRKCREGVEFLVISAERQADEARKLNNKLNELSNLRKHIQNQSSGRKRS
jgi:hypothetical protein